MAVQFAHTAERNPAVLALWRCYHEHKDRSNEAQRELDAWDAKRRKLLDVIQRNDAIARETLDMLSQCGEDVSRIPTREEVG